VTGEVRLWDVDTGKELHRLQGHRDLVYAVAFSPDSKLLASGGGDRDRTVRLWDTSTGKEVRRWDVPLGWVGPLAFSPDSKTLAWGSQQGMISLYDVASGEERRRLRIPGQDETWVMALAFSPDGKTLASGGTEKAARLWDVATGKELPQAGGHR